ncbi:hypothetical protein SNEBB_000853 [Seison nebaliae]|nr:hypothetical protein SNEBB_000853 [Seison nebaliae]
MQGQCSILLIKNYLLIILIRLHKTYGIEGKNHDELTYRNINECSANHSLIPVTYYATNNICKIESCFQQNQVNLRNIFYKWNATLYGKFSTSFTFNCYEPETNFVLDSWQQLLYSLVFFTVIVVAVVGNSLVIWTVLAHRRMRTVTNYFILNLATVDIVNPIFNVGFNSYFMVTQHWPFGVMYCYVQDFITSVSILVNVITLSAISVDRYQAILYPMNWTWFFFFVTYILPIITISFTYIRIANFLWRHQEIGEVTESQLESIRSKRLRTFYPKITEVKFIGHIYLVSYMIAMSNCMYNPFVYCWLNARFRRCFKFAFRWLPFKPCVWTEQDEFELAQENAKTRTFAAAALATLSAVQMKSALNRPAQNNRNQTQKNKLKSMMSMDENSCRNIVPCLLSTKRSSDGTASSISSQPNIKNRTTLLLEIINNKKLEDKQLSKPSSTTIQLHRLTNLWSNRKFPLGRRSTSTSEQRKSFTNELLSSKSAKHSVHYLPTSLSSDASNKNAFHEMTIELEKKLKETSNTGTDDNLTKEKKIKRYSTIDMSKYSYQEHDECCNDETKLPITIKRYYHSTDSNKSFLGADTKKEDNYGSVNCIQQNGNGNKNDFDFQHHHHHGDVNDDDGDNISTNTTTSASHHQLCDQFAQTEFDESCLSLCDKLTIFQNYLNNNNDIIFLHSSNFYGIQNDSFVALISSKLSDSEPYLQRNDQLNYSTISNKLEKGKSNYQQKAETKQPKNKLKRHSTHRRKQQLNLSRTYTLAPLADDEEDDLFMNDTQSLIDDHKK